MASDQFRELDGHREASLRPLKSSTTIGDHGTLREQRTTRRYFESLDVVRTALALLVALGHYFYFDGATGSIPQSFVLAVDFFFVLSGFVLTQSVFASGARSLNDFLKEFAIRRVFRLMPLYLVLLTMTGVVQYLQFGSSLDPSYYFFVSALLLQDVGFAKGAAHLFVGESTAGVGWSVSVEMWVGFLIFPLIYALKTNKAVLFYCCSLVAIVSAALLVNASPDYLGVHYQMLNELMSLGSVRCAFGLSIGCLTYIAFTVVERLSVDTGLMSVVEIMLLALCISMYGKMSYVRQDEFIAPLLFAGVILALSQKKGLVSHLLSSNYLGKVCTTRFQSADLLPLEPSWP